MAAPSFLTTLRTWLRLTTKDRCTLANCEGSSRDRMPESVSLISCGGASMNMHLIAIGGYEHDTLGRDLRLTGALHVKRG